MSVGVPSRQHLRCFEFEADRRDYSLKNHGAQGEAGGMFAMGEETMDLPLEEKMKFASGTTGRSFG